MKCALQEFQHMFPHLTTRIKSRPPVPPNNEPEASFLPMECPILPLDTNFTCSDMLHDPFDEENGPLLRFAVQNHFEAINMRKRTYVWKSPLIRSNSPTMSSQKEKNDEGDI